MVKTTRTLISYPYYHWRGRVFDAGELPADGENNGEGVLCTQEGSTVRAIFNWSNGENIENGSNNSLSWIQSVEQIGSRLTGRGLRCCGSDNLGAMCQPVGRRVTGRFNTCPVRVARHSKPRHQQSDQHGFYVSGSGELQRNISLWTTSEVSNMAGLFDAAAVFNQEIGG